MIFHSMILKPRWVAMVTPATPVYALFREHLICEFSRTIDHLSR